MFASFLAEKRILVCAGSGGVGKTTTSAALALEGARRGKKTLVMTIDPARRLANSLGLPRLDHEERQVPPVLLEAAGITGAAPLFAMMLDQQRAFDEVVEKHTKDPAVRARIFNNRIYQQISSALSGSHEYAAMAKLCQVERTSDYELIIVDTPPAAHALDFLDAPRKISSAVDSPAIDWFSRPLRDGGEFSLKLIGRGGAFVLKRLTKFVGTGFLEDMGKFFVEAGDVLAGFRERATQVDELLRSPAVGFVLVAAPERTIVDEALFFHQRLAAAKMPFCGFVVNRVHAAPPAPPTKEALTAALAADPGVAATGLGPVELARAADAILRSAADVTELARADADQLRRLQGTLGPNQTLAQVPFLDHDVHDVAALAEVARFLV